ncbi:MAG: HAD-IB family hydrolase [Gemmatimonadetes bacterium]|nr:HAD-IB family hydrolase [Gemmatimonadota bacterium]
MTPDFRRAAVFDVDHTLVDGWTGQLFASHLVRKQPFRVRSWRAVGRRGLNLWRAGMQRPAAVETGVRLLAGLTEADADQLARECFDRRIKSIIFDEGVSELVRYRCDPACYCMLASGSSIYIVRAIAAFLGVDAAVGSRGRVQDGVITKTLSHPLCFGEGKLDRVRAHLDAEGISLKNTTFYTDSESDLPLLQAVGEPVVVNPSPMLRLTSRSRGWREEKWRRG